LKLRDVAEISDGEDRLEDGLQPGVVALAGQLVHLQKTLIAALLHFNQVRDLDGRRNLGKIESFTVGDFLLCHWNSSGWPHPSVCGPRRRVRREGIACGCLTAPGDAGRCTAAHMKH